MTMQETAPKTLMMPVWTVYRKVKEGILGWEPVAAFMSKANADAWTSKEYSAIASLDMNAWNAQLYITRAPAMVMQVENKFVIEVQGTQLELIDLSETPDAITLVKATLSMMTEHRRFFNAVADCAESKDTYSRARALMSALTDDDFHMAPKSLPKFHR